MDPEKQNVIVFVRRSFRSGVGLQVTVLGIATVLPVYEDDFVAFAPDLEHRGFMFGGKNYGRLKVSELFHTPEVFEVVDRLELAKGIEQEKGGACSVSDDKDLFPVS